MKPISLERFLKAVNKVSEKLSAKRAEHELNQPEADDFFFVKADKKLVKINFEDILYIERPQRLCYHQARYRKSNHFADHEKFGGQAARNQISQGTSILYRQYQKDNGHPRQYGRTHGRW